MYYRMYFPRLPAFSYVYLLGLSVLTTPGCGKHVLGVVKARSHRSVCGPSGWRTTANLFLKAIGFTVETQRDITQWRSLRVAKIHQETTRQRSTESSCQICADAPLEGLKLRGGSPVPEEKFRSGKTGRVSI